jgi:hypothetical protein
VDGWTERALHAFCARHEISAQERKRLWPRGVRSIAWDLNTAADAEMAAAWPDGAPSLQAIIERRFAANEALRGAVRQLARSDLFDPFNTLARTAQTARLMLRLRGMALNGWRVRRLVVVYSVAVLVWIGDRSDDRIHTHSTIRRGLNFTGLR